MDHESKQGGPYPPLFPVPPAQKGTFAAPPTALAPPQSNHESRVRQRFFPRKTCGKRWWQAPARGGKTVTNSQEKVELGRDRPRGLRNLPFRKRKIPAPRIAGQGFFEACQSPEEPRRSSAVPIGRRFCETGIKTALAPAGCSPGVWPAPSPSVAPSPRAP